MQLLWDLHVPAAHHVEHDPCHVVVSLAPMGIAIGEFDRAQKVLANGLVIAEDQLLAVEEDEVNTPLASSGRRGDGRFP